jgi:hypothetical protein
MPGGSCVVRGGGSEEMMCAMIRRASVVSVVAGASIGWSDGASMGSNGVDVDGGSKGVRSGVLSDADGGSCRGGGRW